MKTVDIDKSVEELIGYFDRRKAVTQAEAEDILPYAKQTLFILDGFLDIVDELNYDKEHFEKLLLSLDDRYYELRQLKERLVPLYSSHNELDKLIDEILTKLMKIENKLGLIIAKNEHKTL